MFGKEKKEKRFEVTVEEYLTLLDLIMKIDLESLPEVNRKESVTAG